MTGELDPWRQKFTYKNEVGRKWDVGSGTCPTQTKFKKKKQYFVDGNILLTPIFCQRQYFVDANILLPPIFCRRQFLSTPTFCRRQCFVGANVLLPPIFCRCQYFVAVNILLPPIFCLCLDFKHDYLLNILLMIEFCVYHDYY